MGHADAIGTAGLSVTVVFSPSAGEVNSVDLLLREGATVADALRESGLSAPHAGAGSAPLAIGVWGVLVSLSDRLRDRDRIEIYRPLQVDPKQARRLRHQAQRKPKP